MMTSQAIKEHKGTIVRIELLEPKVDNPRVGKKLVLENQFEHPFSRRIEVCSEELGQIQYEQACSPAIAAILANGNLRFGVCNMSDTNRFEVCPARGAKLELKLGSEVKEVDYVVFYNLLSSKEIEIIDYGEAWQQKKAA